MLTEKSSAIVIPLRAETSQKPVTFNGDLTNLPAALRSRTQDKRWVVWRWTWRPEPGRWDKPPLQAADPALYVKSNDPTTWGTYQDAVAAARAGHADGIGYMLAGSDLNAADLDDCYKPDTG
jgi:primase-polymerase (primpol)-like protein